MTFTNTVMCMQMPASIPSVAVKICHHNIAPSLWVNQTRNGRLNITRTEPSPAHKAMATFTCAPSECGSVSPANASQLCAI